MKLVRLLILVAIVISPSHAGADDPTADDPLYVACIDDSDGTNIAWAACGAEQVTRASSRMAAVWESITLALRDPATDPDLVADMKPVLVADQAAWDAYRNVACLFYRLPSAGRENQVLGFPNCLTRFINERTRYLRDASELLK